MNWLLLTVLAILSRATYGVATKVLSSRIKVSAMAQAVLLTGSATILTLLLSPLIGGLSFQGVSNLWLITLLMVVSQAFGNILFFKGLEKLDASNTQVVFSSILIWGTLLSVVFLGSHFSLKQFIGIAVLLVAILLVQYQKNMKKLDTYALYILFAAALFAVFQVTSAELARTVSAGAYLLLAYLGSTLIIGAIYFQKVSKELAGLAQNIRNAVTTTLFASSTSLMYFAFSYYAYKAAPDRGVVVLLLTSQVVFGVILAIIFLRERSNIPKKILASILAVAAGLLIKS